MCFIRFESETLKDEDEEAKILNNNNDHKEANAIPFLFSRKVKTLEEKKSEFNYIIVHDHDGIVNCSNKKYMYDEVVRSSNARGFSFK